MCADKTTPIQCLVGGLGSAKSHGGAARAVLDALELGAGYPVGVLAPTYPQLRDYALPALRRVLSSPPPVGLGLVEDRDWVHHKSDKVIRITSSGGEIWYRSADTPPVGSNLATGWIDEPGLISDAAINGFRARLRLDLRRRGRTNQLLMTGSPEGMAGQFYELAEGKPPVFPATYKLRGVDVAHPRAGQRMSRMVNASSHANPYLPPGYVDTNLSGFSPAEREAYEWGRFVPPRGRVYGHWADEVHVRPVGDDWRYADELVVLADFNYRMMVWCLAARWSRTDTLHVIDEWVVEDTSTLAMLEHVLPDLSDRVRDLEGERIDTASAARRFLAVVDASSKGRHSSATDSDMSHLVGAGLRVVDMGGNPRILDSVFSVNAALAERRLFVDPSCEHIRRCLSQQPWGRDGLPAKHPDPKQGLDHGADCVRYGVHWFSPRDRPRGNATTYLPGARVGEGRVLA